MEVTSSGLSSKCRSLKGSLILFVPFGILLFAVLLSFDPEDPSWSQTEWGESVHNIGGGAGAWIADVLFLIFGIVAYTIPIILLGGGWIGWCHRNNREHLDYFSVSLRLIGALSLMLASCGLAEINANDIWYYTSGGVMGSLVSTSLMTILDGSACTVALLSMWSVGLSLLTGFSWITIAENIGSPILKILSFTKNCLFYNPLRHNSDSFRDNENNYEEEYGCPIWPTNPSRPHILWDVEMSNSKRGIEQLENLGKGNCGITSPQETKLRTKTNALE